MSSEQLYQGEIVIPILDQTGHVVENGIFKGIILFKDGIILEGNVTQGNNLIEVNETTMTFYPKLILDRLLYRAIDIMDVSLVRRCIELGAISRPLHKLNGPHNSYFQIGEVDIMEDRRKLSNIFQNRHTNSESDPYLDRLEQTCKICLLFFQNPNEYLEKSIKDVKYPQNYLYLMVFFAMNNYYEFLDYEPLLELFNKLGVYKREIVNIATIFESYEFVEILIKYKSITLNTIMQSLSLSMHLDEEIVFDKILSSTIENGYNLKDFYADPKRPDENPIIDAIRDRKISIVLNLQI